MPIPTYTSYAGEQRISPGISIVGGDIFPESSDEKFTPTNIAEINAELKKVFGGTSDGDGIVFEAITESSDPILDQFLSDGVKKSQ